jgi:hypothetical protein
VPNGQYDLRVHVNPTQVIQELDYTNNAANVRIAIDDSDVTLVE